MCHLAVARCQKTLVGNLARGTRNVAHNNAASSATGPGRRGTKQTCSNEDCSRHFYDLNRAPAACPYCGEELDVTAVARREFEMVARQEKGKRYRLVETPAPAVAEDEPEEEVAADDVEPDTQADVLIDVDDEEADAADDVIVHKDSDEGAP